MLSKLLAAVFVALLLGLTPAHATLSTSAESIELVGDPYAMWGIERGVHHIDDKFFVFASSTTAQLVRLQSNAAPFNISSPMNLFNCTSSPHVEKVGYDLALVACRASDSLWMHVVRFSSYSFDPVGSSFSHIDGGNSSFLGILTYNSSGFSALLSANASVLTVVNVSLLPVSGDDSTPQVVSYQQVSLNNVTSDGELLRYQALTIPLRFLDAHNRLHCPQISGYVPFLPGTRDCSKTSLATVTLAGNVSVWFDRFENGSLILEINQQRSSQWSRVLVSGIESAPAFVANRSVFAAASLGNNNIGLTWSTDHTLTIALVRISTDLKRANAVSWTSPSMSGIASGCISKLALAAAGWSGRAVVLVAYHLPSAAQIVAQDVSFVAHSSIDVLFAPVKISASLLVNQFTIRAQTLKFLLALPGDRVLVVWDSDQEDGERSGVFCRILNSDGAPVSDAIRVNTYTSGYQETPQGTLTSNGNTFLAWTSRSGQDGSGRGVYHQILSPDGSKLGVEIRSTTITNGDQRLATLRAFPTGDVLVLFNNEENLADDPMRDGLYGQVVDTSGFRVGPSVQMFPRTNHSTSPAFDSRTHLFPNSGDILVVDVEYSNQKTDDLFNASTSERAFFGVVYGRIISRTGQHIRSEALLISEALFHYRLPREVLGLVNGSALVVWPVLYDNKYLPPATGLASRIINEDGTMGSLNILSSTYVRGGGFSSHSIGEHLAFSYYCGMSDMCIRFVSATDGTPRGNDTLLTNFRVSQFSVTSGFSSFALFGYLSSKPVIIPFTMEKEEYTKLKSGPVQTLDLGGSNHGSFTITALQSGYFALWHERGVDDPTPAGRTKYGIFGRVLDVYGESFGLPVVVNTYILGSQRYPQVVAFSDTPDKLFVAWRDYMWDKSSLGVAAQVLQMPSLFERAYEEFGVSEMPDTDEFIFPTNLVLAQSSLLDGEEVAMASWRSDAVASEPWNVFIMARLISENGPIGGGALEVTNLTTYLASVGLTDSFLLFSTLPGNAAGYVQYGLDGTWQGSQVLLKDFWYWYSLATVRMSDDTAALVIVGQNATSGFGGVFVRGISDLSGPIAPDLSPVVHAENQNIQGAAFFGKPVVCVVNEDVLFTAWSESWYLTWSDPTKYRVRGRFFSVTRGVFSPLINVSLDTDSSSEFHIRCTYVRDMDHVIVTFLNDTTRAINMAIISTAGDILKWRYFTIDPSLSVYDWSTYQEPIEFVQLPNGNILFLWREYQVGGKWYLIGEIMDAWCTPLSTQFQLQVPGATDVSGGDVILLPDCHLLVSYGSKNRDLGNQYDVFHQIIDCYGEVLSAPRRINSFTLEDQVLPSLVRFRKGGTIAMLWTSYAHENDGSRSIFGALTRYTPCRVQLATNAVVYVQNDAISLPSVSIRSIHRLTLRVVLQLSDANAGNISRISSNSFFVAQLNAVSAGKWTASGPAAALEQFLSNLQFMPRTDYIASVNITYEVTDDQGNVNTATVALTEARAANHAPVIAGISDYIARVGRVFQRKLPVIVDPEAGDVLSISIGRTSHLHTPFWLHLINGTSPLFMRGIPQPSDVGETVVILTADDGRDTASVEFRVNVLANNRPTVSLSIGSRSVSAGSSHEISLSGIFSDADGDPLTVSVTYNGQGALPPWVTFVASAVRLIVQPPESSVGHQHVFHVMATDGVGSASDDLNLSVTSNTPASESFVSQYGTSLIPIALGTLLLCIFCALLYLRRRRARNIVQTVFAIATLDSNVYDAGTLDSTLTNKGEALAGMQELVRAASGRLVVGLSRGSRESIDTDGAELTRLVLNFYRTDRAESSDMTLFDLVDIPLIVNTAAGQLQRNCAVKAQQGKKSLPIARFLAHLMILLLMVETRGERLLSVHVKNELRIKIDEVRRVLGRSPSKTSVVHIELVFQLQVAREAVIGIRDDSRSVRELGRSLMLVLSPGELLSAVIGTNTVSPWFPRYLAVAGRLPELAKSVSKLELALSTVQLGYSATLMIGMVIALRSVIRSSTDLRVQRMAVLGPPGGAPGLGLRQILQHGLRQSRVVGRRQPSSVSVLARHALCELRDECLVSQSLLASDIEAVLSNSATGLHLDEEIELQAQCSGIEVDFEDASLGSVHSDEETEESSV